MLNSDIFRVFRLENSLLDCMENQNKALFSTFLWCRMIGLMPDFLVPDQDWSQYKLPLFPNLKQMSEITSQKLSSFVNEGGLAYIFYQWFFTFES